MHLGSRASRASQTMIVEQGDKQVSTTIECCMEDSLANGAV